ncbi:MAG: RDD family protein [Spirosomaceae bacterium]|nr:RDD family protein [Spirosomataceae bacterium]
MSVLIQTSQNVPVEYELASVGERIVANLIDIIIYIGWAVSWSLIFSQLRVAGAFFSMLLIILPIMMYPLFTEYFLNGQTLGKRAINIKVIRLDGSQPSLGDYVLRWLFIVIDNGFFSSLVAVIAIASGGKGQRLGDIAAGTTVIKTKKRVTLDQIIYESPQENYQVTYLQRKQNPELLDMTADKIAQLLGASQGKSQRQFLQTIVNDYAYLVAKEAEEF